MDGRIDVSIVTNSDIRTASSSAHARASAGTNPRVAVCSDASTNGCIDVSTDVRIDHCLDASTDDRIDPSLHDRIDVDSDDSVHGNQGASIRACIHRMAALLADSRSHSSCALPPGG